MPRPPDSGRIDLPGILYHTQRDLASRLSLASLIEHATAAGTTAEQHWIDFLNRHLPPRYRATQAFIFDSHGRRSRQIDLAIYDHLEAPSLYRETPAIHLPVDLIHAVFEVKPSFSRPWLRDAAEKAASVQSLDPSRKVVAGLLAKSSAWSEDTFAANLRAALASTPNLTLGCCLDQGSFFRPVAGSGRRTCHLSEPDGSLHFLIWHLLSHLSPGLKHYWRGFRERSVSDLNEK